MWNSVYTKIAAMGFCMGAGMEYFMIQTGFYDKYVYKYMTFASPQSPSLFFTPSLLFRVVEIEAERILEHKEEREHWLSELEKTVRPSK